MLTNRQIKNKQLFALNQRLISLTGDLRQAERDLIHDINECAVAEYNKANKLKRGVLNMRLKATLKRYFDVYGRKYACESDIEQLKAWGVLSDDEERKKFGVKE